MKTLNEEQLQEVIDKKSRGYASRYKAQFEALQNSPLAMVRPISSYDIFALGEQFDQFSNYATFVRESGTAADLGKLPTIAIDIISGVYGASIIPLICSVQPIEEERGVIYFKTTRAINARGNVAANQIIRQPMAAPDVYPVGFAGELIQNEVWATTTAAVLSYGFTAASDPVRPNYVKIYFYPMVGGTLATTPTITLMDDGNGNLLGNGASGTIDYVNGTGEIYFVADPGTGGQLQANYGTSFEAGGQYAMINYTTQSTDIHAEIFVLGTEMGLFKAYSLQKRFGKVAEDEMTADLTNEINAELGNTAVSRLLTALPANSTDVWYKGPPAGVPYALHKLEMKDRIAQRDGVIQQQAGRGAVNLLIAGSTAASVIAGLPGFEKSPVVASGPHFYGTLDGIPVIRCPQFPTGMILTIYKGTGNFDAPISYAPYMPLFLSGTIPMPTNILIKQQVAAVWAGMKVVAPAFISAISVVPGIAP